MAPLLSLLHQAATRLARPHTLRAVRLCAARLSSSAPALNRAVVFSENGNPTQVLSVKSYEPLPPPPPGALNVRFRLSPINPSDINIVQGVYPAKPTRVTISGKELSVGGNEGLAEVVEVGDGVQGFEVGDWVISGKQQAGTWSTTRTLRADDTIKLPAQGLSEVNAATIAVNPATAFCMLHEFLDLKEGDWVLQNGDRLVGQAVIQIAARKGIKTINFVRTRHVIANDIDNLIASLTSLGANHVFTYESLEDRTLGKNIKQWTAGNPIRLMLNCVGGPTTLAMTRYLGENAHLVSYGAMSKQPLALPTSAFIFKNLQAHGHWQSRWYKEHSRQDREDLMDVLTALQLKEPEHEILDLSDEDNDGLATQKLRHALDRMERPYGRKILLRL
ncbi:NAD(P)-binding protein [Epithele typhae]|uniref:NAD(P)-binding protein n=1 Tax=Epithele typhae TaxID=378194 RepID=UPI002008613D|nr:NAD(P)-binding protein [Epithele typhae]KAH9935893.1 NAD(P)-binding protein [Epithele typhae]